MAGELRLTGSGRFFAVACRSVTGELLMPCGRFRPVLYEFGGPGCLLDTPRGVLPLSEVLADAFGPADLSSVSRRPARRRRRAGAPRAHHPRRDPRPGRTAAATGACGPA